MLNEVTRDANAFPPCQATGNAHVFSANQSHKDPPVFILEQPCESPLASTPNHLFADLFTTPARPNVNTSASTPYQLAGNNQNMPDMASHELNHRPRKLEKSIVHDVLTTFYHTQQLQPSQQANQKAKKIRPPQIRTPRTTTKTCRMERENSSRTSNPRAYHQHCANAAQRLVATTHAKPNAQPVSSLQTPPPNSFARRQTTTHAKPNQGTQINTPHQSPFFTPSPYQRPLSSEILICDGVLSRNGC